MDIESSGDKNTLEKGGLNKDLQGTMKDIEIGGKTLVEIRRLEFLKPWFDIPQYDYYERCEAALCPYLSFDVSFINWLKRMFKKCKVLILSGTEQPETASDRTVEAPRVQGDVSYDLNNYSFIDSVVGIRINKNDKLYNALTRIKDFPDLFGPCWINILTAGSLFSIYGLHVVFHSGRLNPFISLAVLFELIFLCLTSSILMGLSVTLCRYYFTKDFSINQAIRFICLCGYTQIPLAFICKISVWTSLVMVCFPLFEHLFYVINLVTYFYLCFSTSTTLLLALPSIEPSQHENTFKTLSIILAYIIQATFLIILQSYIS